MSQRGRTRRLVLLTVISIPFLYPFLFLLGVALKPRDDYSTAEGSLPSQLTLDNVSDAWSGASLGSAMVHSIIAVSVGVVVTLLISTLGAYWFTRHEGRLATTLRIGLILTMVIPLPVFIIPLFLQLSDVSLTNNLYVMGLVFAGWNSSFGLYLTYSFMKGLPAEVLEAAQIDGATLWQQLRLVIVPLCRPVLVTLAVLTFIWSWSDLFASVVIVQDPGSRLLIPSTALLADEYSSNVPQQAAGVVIAMIPMLFVFLAGQRALVRGITAGVGK